MEDLARPDDDARRSLVEEAHDLVGDLPRLLSDRVRLISLELKRAEGALGQMASLGLLAAILAATSWVALWVGFAAGMIALGLAWFWAALIVFVLNVAAALWCALRVRALAPLLTLPATMRQLTEALSERPEPKKERPAAPPAQSQGGANAASVDRAAA